MLFLVGREGTFVVANGTAGIVAAAALVGEGPACFSWVAVGRDEHLDDGLCARDGRGGGVPPTAAPGDRVGKELVKATLVLCGKGLGVRLEPGFYIGGSDFE